MEENQEWTVYIIEAVSGVLYTGITKDLERRFEEHKNKTTGAKFFHFSTPEKVVHQEKHANRSDATKREIEIKKMSRKGKLDLIKKGRQGRQGSHEEFL